MKFVTTKELSLKGAGYLVSNDKPVTHVEFVQAQEKAHYFVKLAENIKDKNFKINEVDSFDKAQDEVINQIFDENTVKYEAEVKKPSMTMQDKLTKESLDWLKYQDTKESVDGINNAMQDFNIIKEFEDFGLYFSEGIVKLSKIYTTKQILDAIKLIDEKTK